MRQTKTRRGSEVAYWKCKDLAFRIVKVYARFSCSFPRRSTKLVCRPFPCAFVVLQIQELILDNCYSTAVVGLTDEFVNLEVLSLIKVGLTNLKNFPNLPNLRRVSEICRGCSRQHLPSRTRGNARVFSSLKRHWFSCSFIITFSWNLARIGSCQVFSLFKGHQN